VSADGQEQREADRREAEAEELGRAEAADYAVWEITERERIEGLSQRRADAFRDFLIDLLRPVR
jgi:hypothetical protein